MNRAAAVLGLAALVVVSCTPGSPTGGPASSSASVSPVPVSPGPTSSEPTEPGSTDPGSTDPGSTDPGSTERGPTLPEVVDGPGLTAVVGARVFDGTAVHERATVVFGDDGIVAVADADAITPGPAVEVVDGTGRTLLPGLLDAHQHVLDESDLVRDLAFGVTTALDMFNDPGFVGRLRSEQSVGDAEDRADVFSAGSLATVPGGHGTQYGLDVPTIEDPDRAAGWVDERLVEGSDWIKVVVESGVDGDRPTLSRATVAALASAAHDRGALVVAHVSRAGAAQDVVAAGVDGLAHVWLDGAEPDGFADRLARDDVFVVPTLSVFDDRERPVGEGLPDDPEIGPRLTDDEIAQLEAGFPVPAVVTELALASVADLHDAGVTLLAGTDTGNDGVVPGASLHGELELLVEAGLSPTESLRAATLAPADAFGLDDRGRVEPGARADLVLVDGDPTTDVTATRAIVAVYKDGRRTGVRPAGN